MIERVIIKNYKGIKSADIKFHDFTNIIVGNNGVGKSTIIEAMSLGKAIIASDVVGNVDCVVNGYNGFLVPLIKDAFVDAVCRMIENDSERIKFEINSRKLFEERFLITNRIKDLEKIYISSIK